MAHCITKIAEICKIQVLVIIRGGFKMSVVKKVSQKVTECTNSVVKAMVVQNANSACIWLAHQPKFPKEADKLKKQNNR